MANHYDAIVIGGGHNGLTSGAYLSKEGAKTVVLEALDHTGGAADSSNPFPKHPDVKVTTYSYVVSLVPPTIINDLGLKRFGYNIVPFGPYFQAFPDGRAVTVYADDAKKSRESISQFSAKDADAMEEWEEWLKGVADVLGPLLIRVPPKVGGTTPADLLAQADAAWRMRKLGVRGVASVTKLFSMSVTDLLNEWFESDAVKGMLAVNGVIGTWAGPDEPGTAYVMLHHSIGDVGDGHLGSWGFQEGGMGAVSDIFRKAAESFGCEVRTNARVSRILTTNGHVRGVVLEGGEELYAPVVVSAIHPKIAFLDMLQEHELPADFVRDIRNWRTRSGVVKVNVAIDKLPEFTAAKGYDDRGSNGIPAHLTGSVELCYSPEYAERAFQDAHMEHKASDRPFVDGVIPTTLVDGLGDKEKGIHNFSMYTQWCPYEWSTEPHAKELDAYAKRIFDEYDSLAPGFKDSIVDYQVIGPYDMEQRVGLIGGNIFHGELAVDQLFHMRPAPGYADYRTPIKGLYHGSCATHGGGGINGIPGWQAFRAAKKDKMVKTGR
jgi:phytoene dehydrogenase-like protein